MKQGVKKIVFVTTYPKWGQLHGAGVIGQASYAKYVVSRLARRRDVKVVVVAEKNGEDSHYTEKKVEVRRVWSWGDRSVFWNVAKQINRKEQKVIAQWGMSIYGSLLQSFGFVLFLLYLRLRGIWVAVVLHEVVVDIRSLHGHIGTSKNDLIMYVYQFGLKLFYNLIGVLASKIIVPEPFLAVNIRKICFRAKVAVIRHGIEQKTLKGRSLARREFGFSRNKFIVGSFGFIAWYKGSDLIWRLQRYVNRKGIGDINLVLVGGANPNRLGRKFYLDYLDEVEKNSQRFDVMVSGFVEDEQMSKYFAAVDLVVLPYREFTGTSGPLALALAHHKPVLLSKNISRMLDGEDWGRVFEKFGIEPHSIVFDINRPEDFLEKVRFVKDNRFYRKRLSDLANGLAKMRSWERTAREYYDQIFF